MSHHCTRGLKIERKDLMKRSVIFVYILVAHSSILFTRDVPLFYHASPLFLEPRLERDWLTSIEVDFRGGNAKKGFNGDSKQVSILDMYGTHSMKNLGAGIPGKDSGNILDAILTGLELVPNNDQFAQLSIGGKYTIIEGSIFFVQNITHGLFFQFFLPIRSIEASQLSYADLSPTQGPGATIHAIEWQRFLAFFDDILARYELDRKPFDQTHIGDLEMSIGWTHNYQETTSWDFIDFSIVGGLVLPTGAKKDLSNIFSLPFGHEKHLGFQLQTRFALGIYDWLTLGSYGEGTVYAPETMLQRVKTATGQSGIIKLAKTSVETHEGSQWRVGSYIKADHAIRGLSVLLGYSFSGQDKTTYTPQDTQSFFYSIINSDEMLQGWNMHTFHFAVEYDFAHQHSTCGPRISFFYDKVIKGKRVFKTNMFTASAGIEILWLF